MSFFFYYPVIKITYIWIFLSDDLAKKLEKIREPYLFQEYSEGLGFCYLPIKQIEKYQRSFKREANNFPHHTNRIYYLAERLQVKNKLFCLTNLRDGLENRNSNWNNAFYINIPT